MAEERMICTLTLLIVVTVFSLPCGLASSWRIPATEVKYRLQENSPPGHVLGIVAGPAPQKSVTNAFGAPSQFFHLDPLTSELSLKSEIDAEKLCALANRRDDDNGGVYDGGLTDVITCNPLIGELAIQLDVNVLLPDGGLQAVFKVTVDVIDVDDNPPRFDKQRIWKRQLREALYRKGRKIDLPKARDADLLPEHRIIRYRLEPQSHSVDEVFHLEVSSSETPTLVLLKDLDTETQEYFNMTLVAFNPSRGPSHHGMYLNDHPSSHSLESRLQVEICVVDMNDNEPYFDRSSYNVTVPEDTPPGSIIFKLEAHDDDRSAQLDYALIEAVGSSHQAIASIFEVEKGGRVVLRRPLDFESVQTYILPVRVTDGDFNAETTLHVAVADVNDEEPRFEINPIHLIAEEGTAAKRSIGQVRVYDPDSVEVNGVVRCKEPEDVAHRQVLTFSPDPQGHPSAGLYDLQTRIELDRESPDTLPSGIALVRLICWDANELLESRRAAPLKRLTHTMTATLTIRDINDNPPTFLEPVYHVTVPENNHIGAKMVQVQAHDPDEGENADITYSLLDRANFNVDPVSGWVSAAIEFDREKRDSYQVTIVATDNGPQRLTGSALLNVTIIDQNDNAPHLLPCDKIPNPLVVWENSPVGTFVGNLIATDEDAGRNGEIVFRLSKKLGSTSHFELRPNGSVFTAMPLDREQKANYELLVEIRDRGNPNVLSSTESMCITVLDENDNDPRFVLPDRLYSIEDRLWDIPSTILRKRESSDMASDAGIGPSKSGDETGGGDSSSYEPSLRISMHEISGQLVSRLEATDPDGGDNGRVLYSLRRHAQSRSRVNRAAGDFLGVDENTGEVWLKRALQEEDLGAHAFIVSASDQGTPLSRSESRVMLISVEDIPPRSLDVGGESSSFIASADGGEGLLATLFPIKLGEKKNVLILAGLISVSVVLAIILVTAMICMLKPCRPFSRQSRRFFHQNSSPPPGAMVFNGDAMSPHNGGVNGGVISLQEARLIDNTSMDNLGLGQGNGGTGHDYGYGELVDPDVGWMGNGVGKGATTYRVVSADTVSTVSEEANSRVPQMWNKCNSLPRDSFDRCVSPQSGNHDTVCGCASTAGGLMTPLREIEENSQGLLQSPSHWATPKIPPEARCSASHIAVPVTLLPAMCLRSSANSVATASNPFAPTSATSANSTIRLVPTEGGAKVEKETRIGEHASDSGQGGSDDDIAGCQFQLPPVINLVQLPCEYGEDPWKRSAAESLCSHEVNRVQKAANFTLSENLNCVGVSDLMNMANQPRHVHLLS